MNNLIFDMTDETLTKVSRTVDRVVDFDIIDNLQDTLDLVFSEQSLWFDRILFGVESRKLRVAHVVGDK